jgi:large subunit ribosomal protein L6
MSRIGKKPIDLPENVSVDILQQKLIVIGKYGRLENVLENFLKVHIENKKLYLLRTEENTKAKTFHGLYRAIIQNMILGVTKKFQKALIAEGIGYKFQIEKKNLLVNVGFTHPVQFEMPEDLEIRLESPTKLIISGINKEKVGFFADKIRSIRPPEPYKGKGLLYEGEKIRRKAGKTGK